jgi:hypothetical protein
MALKIDLPYPTRSHDPPHVPDVLGDTRSGVVEVAVGEGTQDADPRLDAAARALAQAVHRLRTIRRNALGGSYDQPTFEKAVVACRLAEADVHSVRQEFDAARAAAGERRR